MKDYSGLEEQRKVSREFITGETALVRFGVQLVSRGDAETRRRGGAEARRRKGARPGANNWQLTTDN
jgi:hypothetical protein